MKFITFFEVHETEFGPVLAFKEDDPGAKHPFILVYKAKLDNGDYIQIRQSYESESTRDCDFAFPETCLKSMVKEIRHCNKVLEQNNKETQS